jgi:peptidoglycan/LPS O-acetylase OafA/YrhL
MNDPAAPADASALNYRPELDGIRGIAIALVVMAHALLPTGFLEGGGFVGVTLFFVLSGFLITSILVEEHRATSRISLRNFYERRVRRLGPALIVFLAAFFAWSTIAGLDRRTDILAALFYGSDIVEATGGTMHELGHLWSLAVEEQFYLVWPLAVMGLVLIGRGASRILLFLVAVLAAWRFLVFAGTLDWARVYFGPDTVAVALVAGAALALTPLRVRRPRAAGAGGLATLLVLALTVNHSTAPSATILLLVGVPVAIGASIMLLMGAATMPGLSSRPLVWLGGISYALYLWHTGLNSILGSVYGWDVVPRLLTIPVAVGIAAISLRFVETPFRHRRTRSRGSTLQREPAGTLGTCTVRQRDLPAAAALSAAPGTDV